MIRSIHRQFIAGVALLCAAATFSAPALAVSVDVRTPVDVSESFVPSQSVLVQPSSFMVSEYFSSVAGTVTLSVQRVPWADLFSQLSTTVNLQGVDGKLSMDSVAGPAMQVFDLAAGQRFTTSVYALTAGPRGYGAYTLDISFLPTAVPLPAAAWLLLSGIGGLAVAARRRRPAARAA